MATDLSSVLAVGCCEQLLLRDNDSIGQVYLGRYEFHSFPVYFQEIIMVFDKFINRLPNRSSGTRLHC